MTVTIYQGDSLGWLRKLPDQSVDCCITSPPYFGLRDYGAEGQIGLETTPDIYIEKMVQVFAEVRRVLRQEGTLWLNLGDGYAGPWGAQSRGKEYPGTLLGGSMIAARQIANRTYIGDRTKAFGKPKDMMGIPWRTALALQTDGWWLRQALPWVKRNPVPESVKDRPGSAVEYIFMLTSARRYFYDYEAVKLRMFKPEAAAAVRPKKSEKRCGRAEQRSERTFRNSDLFFESLTAPHGAIADEGGQIIALDVATHPFPGAHFATFPPRLVEPLIRASCPSGGTVLDPFAGAGTTGLVADRLGRSAIMIELNPSYVEMARARIAAESFLTEIKIA